MCQVRSKRIGIFRVGSISAWFVSWWIKKLHNKQIQSEGRWTANNMETLPPTQKIKLLRRVWIDFCYQQTVFIIVWTWFMSYTSYIVHRTHSTQKTMLLCSEPNKTCLDRIRSVGDYWISCVTITLRIRFPVCQVFRLLGTHRYIWFQNEPAVKGWVASNVTFACG